MATLISSLRSGPRRHAS